MGLVLAGAAHLHLDAKVLFDGLTHCGPAPQAEIHLELLGASVDDHALEAVFLGLTQHSTIASGAANEQRGESLPSRQSQTDRRHFAPSGASPGHRDDLHDLSALFVQPHDLLATLMKLP